MKLRLTDVKEALLNFGYTAERDSIGRPIEWSGFRLPSDYCDLMSTLGGFVLNDRSFVLFPCQSSGRSDGGIRSAMEWNEEPPWRREYGFLARKLFFFAEDAFGNQFAYDFAESSTEPDIVLFYCEGGRRQRIGSSLYHLLVGNALTSEEGIDPLDRQMLQKARIRGLVPKVAQHLSYKMPLIVGGELDVDNLEVMDGAAHLHLLGQLSLQLSQSPPGTRIDRFESL